MDHFDAQNQDTWSQRYFVNDTFFDGTGPVFLCVGGEGPPLQTDVCPALLLLGRVTIIGCGQRLGALRLDDRAGPASPST